MKVNEFVRLSMDTTLLFRDRRTGQYIKDWKDFMDKEVVGFYARTHDNRDSRRTKAQIIVMVR